MCYGIEVTLFDNFVGNTCYFHSEALMVRNWSYWVKNQTSIIINGDPLRDSTLLNKSLAVSRRVGGCDVTRMFILFSSY